MAADITGSFAVTMLERSTTAWRVKAPIAMVEPLGRFCGQITTTEVSLMSIKFEGEPPFYMGVAETAAAQVLDTNVIVRVTVSTSKARPKSVPVRFTIAPEVAKSLAEQLVVAARMAEMHKHRGHYE
jgi:hypothetical protein